MQMFFVVVLAILTVISWYGFIRCMVNPNCFAFVEPMSKNVTGHPRIVLLSPSFTTSNWIRSPICLQTFCWIVIFAIA